jgi:integrase
MKRGPYRSAPEPGTFADLILRYRQGPRVRGWAPGTLRKNDKILGDFLTQNGREPVASLRRGDFIAMRDSMAATPSEANNWAKVIRGLLDYAVDLEIIDFNPAARVKRLKTPNPDGFRTWREDEIAAFERHFARGSLPRLAFTLALYTGAARGDLVRLGWGNIRGERLSYRRQKTRGEVDIPILSPLADELSQVPHTHLTFLQTEAGRVRSDVGLANQLTRWLALAGLWDTDEHGHHLSLHGLRKALGRRLAEAGVDPHGIASVLGQDDARSALVYSRKFNRARTADASMARLAEEPATNVTRLERNATRKGTPR